MADTDLIERTITVSGLNGGPSRELLAIIDTGASYCQIPEDIAREIGAKLLDTDEVQLPNGRWVPTQLWGIIVELGGRRTATTSILGPTDGPTLVSKFALGQMGYGVDPVGNRLIRQAARMLFLTRWPTF